MSSTPYAGRARFGLLPEPERNPASVITSAIINCSIIALFIFLGTLAHHELETRKMESMEIVFPVSPPPEIKVKVKMPPMPKVPDVPRPETIKIALPKILLAKPEPKPEIKELPMVKEAVNLPKIAAKPQVVTLAPQPKAAMANAAAPALVPQQHVSTAPVHFGSLNGVTPNPNATRPATIAAIGNPYGGNSGPAKAPQGIVGSTGFGNGTRSGSSAGVVGKVASAGIPGGTGTAPVASAGRVASAGIPAMTAPSGAPAMAARAETSTTPPVLISYAKAEYTHEALELKIQGEVVLRVTVTTGGTMVVQGVLHGLGHGLDDAAVRSAPTHRFKPATRNGQAVDYTTNIIVKFQTA
jgi:TonB family protein